MAANLLFLILPLLLASLEANPDVIPLIDIQAWTSTDTTFESRSSIARQVGAACQESGFFSIKNHGVNDTIMKNVWQATTDFFDLPMAEKLSYKTHNETEYPYGYERSETLVVGKSLDGKNTEDTDGSSDSDSPAPDLKETYALGPPSDRRTGMPPRRYPQNPSYMKEALDEYYQEMEQLANILLQIFAMALDLPELWFEDKMDRHMSALRLLNYFDVSSSNTTTGQLRAGAHTDYGALTILKSGGPGLQVKSGENWVDVPYLPEENTFVINIGDLMSRWTNDKWVSTLHRVVLPPMDGKEHRRQSIAYFVNINGDAQVTPLETCVDSDNPSKYPPISAWEHLMSKHLASMSASSDANKADVEAKDEL